MTDIQALILQLNDKVKHQTDDLAKKEQEVMCLKSLISNNKNELKRIVADMDSSTGSNDDELAG